MLTCTEGEERLPKDYNEGLVSAILCPIMEEEAIEKMPELEKPKKTANMLLLGVHKNYRGKNIANNLVRLSLSIIKDAGYENVPLFAASHFSNRVSEKNGFTSIYELDVKNWLWKGEKLLQTMEEQHRYYKYWVKKL